ncbi:DUF3152 domain-containing protein [Kitasatospora sp. NPDC087315]|uniref:DUF3152 domain-containing protein n=1 Tax=Kitasatospora sp. NPDC087315 TaxID=3364069 RepID=UPI00381B9354
MPVVRPAQRSSRTRGTQPGAGRRNRRRRRLGPGMTAALLAAVTVLGGTLYALNRPDALPGAGPTAQGRVAPPADSTPAPTAPEPAKSPDTAPPPPAAPATTPAPTPALTQAATPTPERNTPDPGPAKGAGTFTVATGSAAPVGAGNIRRYRVEVEDGIGIDPAAAAAQIQGILADKRGWTNDRKNGFQLVAGGSYDFTVKIGSPAAVDRICGQAGLDTHGEVNCAVGNQVMVNVKRWNTGSPQFSGPIDEYRALIVNHEVGHRIGHGHETCPGKGRPAPAMMQQIYGLKGCESNAWPYSAEGSYLGGPSVP